MTTPNRESLMDAFRRAATTEQRALVARQLRALDDARTDAGECDCSDASCQACVDRLDGPDSLDLRKAGRWLGSDRVRSLRTEEDRTDRAVLAEMLLEAARRAGELTDDLAARIRGASLDVLRAAYEQCPDPEEERTDTMSHDPEAAARAAMNRAAHTAWTRPLGGAERDPAPEPTDEQRVRIDAAGRAYDALERDRADYQRGRPSVTERMDADEPPGAPAKAERGTPVEELEQLIAIAKREGKDLDEVLSALERVKQMRTADDSARSDALDESGARSRMQHDAAVAWTRAPGVGADGRVRDPVPTLRDGVLDVGSFGSSFGGA